MSEASGRIRVEQYFEPEEENVIAPMHASEAAQRVLRERPVTAIAAGETAEPSPAVELIQRHEAERRDVNERVAFLFPRPETCQWDIREIGYDRRRRAETQAS